MSRGPHPDDILAALVELAARRDRLAIESHQSIVDLGAVARQARAARLTVDEIAAAAGVSRQTVYAAMSRHT